MAQDNGEHIEISFDSSVYSVDENSYSNRRFVLGYISGVYEVESDDEVYVTVSYKRNEQMRWESITFRLKKDEKRFHQKLPAGITAIEFYIRIYGWVKEFELTSLKVSVKEISVGKFAGSSLLLYGEAELQPEPPSFVIDYIPFEIKIPLVGDLKANQATVTWATTHKATSRIRYGNSPENLNMEVVNGDFIYYHQMLLEGLELEEIYYCKIYSTSEITKKEISTDIIAFSTGKEITIQSINLLSEAISSLKLKNVMAKSMILNETETLLTTEPDRDNESVSNSAAMSSKTKVDISTENRIGNEFDYTVSP